jgi:phage terminase small subunit
MKSDFTDRQQRFISEYLNDFNATAAAIRAGYSVATARQMGSENLSKPDIRAEIQMRLAAREERSAFRREMLIDRLVQELDADVADLFDAAGNLLPIQQWPAVWRRGMVRAAHVEEVRILNGVPHIHRTYLRLSDRISQQIMLGRLIGSRA